MDKYLEAEKKLAELLGWEGLQISVPSYSDALSICIVAPTGRIIEADVPRWTRDNAAAFSLMVEHEMKPDFRPYCKVGVVGYPEISEFGGKDMEAAVRYAIVMAVIAKLTNKE